MQHYLKYPQSYYFSECNLKMIDFKRKIVIKTLIIKGIGGIIYSENNCEVFIVFYYFPYTKIRLFTLLILFIFEIYALCRFCYKYYYKEK